MTESKKNPLGPTGERVQANVARIRDQRGLTYRELTERLTTLGRVIPVLGLSRIERGERRVDADDLVALALALGVNASTLLLPPTAKSEPVALTPAVTASALEAWGWADGESPMLRVRWPDEVGDVWDDFQRFARPREASWLERHTAFRAAADVAARVEVLLNTKHGVGINAEQEQARAEQQVEAVKSLRRALARLEAELADLVGDDDGS